MILTLVRDENEALPILIARLKDGHGKMIVCCAVFRWAKQLAHRVADAGFDIRYDVDNVTVSRGDSSVKFMSVGTGEKLRGLRCGDVLLVMDEMSPEAIGVVAGGFCAVSPREAANAN